MVVLLGVLVALMYAKHRKNVGLWLCSGNILVFYYRSTVLINFIPDRVHANHTVYF